MARFEDHKFHCRAQESFLPAAVLVNRLVAVTVVLRAIRAEVAEP